MSVPRRYLLVWTGRRFPYVGRLAVESIAQADPGAEIRIFLLGDRPASVDWDRLADVPGVVIERIDLDALFGGVPHGRALLSVFGAIPDRAASARSNLLRYALLYEHGGVYVDFDVVVLRPMPELAGGRPFIGAERVWAYDQARLDGTWSARMAPGTMGWATAWCARRLDSRCFAGRGQMSQRLERVSRLWTTVQANNAVIGAPPASPFVGLLLDRALRVDPTVRYALGPALVSHVAATDPETVTVLPEDVLYPVPPGESFRFFEDRTLTLGPSTALIHYVGSNHRSLLAGIGDGDPRFARSEVFWRLSGQVERRRQAGRHHLKVVR